MTQEFHAKDHEDRRLIYEQQWKLFRHQDTLRWSRIKTIALIELVIGYSTAAVKDSPVVPPWMQAPLVIAVCFLVLFVSLLAVKDDLDSSYHVNIAAHMGAQMGIPLREHSCIEKVLRGRVLMGLAIITVNAFNFWVLYKVYNHS